MKTEESLCSSTFEDRIRIAERELSVFAGAVTQNVWSRGGQTFGGGWLDQSELMDSPPLSTSRNWGGHDRDLGETGKSASGRAASQIRSPRWCKDSPVLHAKGSARRAG